MDFSTLLPMLTKYFKTLHPARLTLMAEMIFALIQTKHVHQKNLALGCKGSATQDSCIRRVQRFFKETELDPIAAGQFIKALAPQRASVVLAIDRTNWKFGVKNINYLVVSQIQGSVSIPIAFKALEKRGNSNTTERCNLMNQVFQVYQPQQIKVFLGDREFVGDRWMTFLIEKQIPFALRMKQSTMVETNQLPLQASQYLSALKVNEMSIIQKTIGDHKLFITIKRLVTKELLIVASHHYQGEEALRFYKKRWSIEMTFKAMKTHGFNLESTHMTDLAKLEKLMLLLTIALAISILAGELKAAQRPIPVKNHHRRLVTLFTYGLDWLREYLLKPRLTLVTHLADLLINTMKIRLA